MHRATGFANDPAAFDALFRHFHPRLVRFLSKVLEQTSIDPDDVAQESMVKVWTKREQFDARYQFSTWVYTIARRTATDAMRKHVRDRGQAQNPRTLDEMAQPTASPNEHAATNEAAQQIWLTAERVLPANQYLVLWLRYGEEMTIAEVAKALSKSSVSVRVLLHRARTKLQACLDTDGSAKAPRGESDR